MSKETDKMQIEQNSIPQPIQSTNQQMTPKKQETEPNLQKTHESALSEKRSTVSKANNHISREETDSAIQQNKMVQESEENHESSSEEPKSHYTRGVQQDYSNQNNSAKQLTPKKLKRGLGKKQQNKINGPQYIDSKFRCFNAFCPGKIDIITTVQIKANPKNDGKEFQDKEYNQYKAYEGAIKEFHLKQNQDTLEIYLCEYCMALQKQSQFCYYCKQIYDNEINIDNGQWIQCDQCLIWHHAQEAEKYKPDEFNEFNLMGDNPNFEYKCPICFYSKEKLKAVAKGKGVKNNRQQKQRIENKKQSKRVLNQAQGAAIQIQQIPEQGNPSYVPQGHASHHHHHHHNHHSNNNSHFNPKKNSIDETIAEDNNNDTIYSHNHQNGGVNVSIYTTGRFKDNQNLAELQAKNKKKEKEKEKQYSKLEEILLSHGIKLQLNENQIQEDIQYFQNLRLNSMQMDEMQNNQNNSEGCQSPHSAKKSLCNKIEINSGSDIKVEEKTSQQKNKNEIKHFDDKEQIKKESFELDTNQKIQNPKENSPKTNYNQLNLNSEKKQENQIQPDNMQLEEQMQEN